MAVVDITPGLQPTPTVTNQNMTVSVFLNNPPLVQRSLNDLTNERLVTPQLYGRGPDTTAGAVAYDQLTANDLYLTRDVAKIAPGAQFPRTTDEVPVPLIAAIDKWGTEEKIPKEVELRNNFSKVSRTMTKIANTIVRKVDVVGLQALKDADTLDYTFSATWAASDINAIIAGLIGARLKSIQTKMGYRPDTLLLNTTHSARLLTAAIDTGKKLFGEFEQASVVRNGYVGRLMGFDIFESDQLEDDEPGWLIERGRIGEISNETDLFTDVYYDKSCQSWIVQGSRSFVPYVTDPLAAVELIGIA